MVEPVKNESKIESMIYSVHDILSSIEYKLEPVLADLENSELPKKWETIIDDRLINLLERVKILNERIKL